MNVIADRVRQGIVASRKEFPVHANRASSLGHPCVRYLFYQRTAHDKRELFDPGLLEIFEEGNAQERTSRDALQRFGRFDIVEQEREIIIPEHNITGHIDGGILPINRDDPDWPIRNGEAQKAPFELKSMNEHIWAGIDTLDDMLGSPYYWIRGYPTQLNIYLEGTGQQMGVFLLKSKAAMRFKEIWIEHDPVIVAEAFAKADEVEAHVKSGVAPERCEGEHCKRCGYLTHCAPDMVNKSSGEWLNNPELEELLIRRHELTEAGKEFNQVDRRIKKMLEGVDHSIVCGDFVITAKEIQRKGYTVDPGTSIRRTIEYVGETT